MMQAISTRPGAGPPGLLMRWETVLALLLIATIVMNSLLSPYFLDVDNLFDSTYTFSEKAMIALPMSLLIISREIDVSVASIIALSAVLMGLAASAGTALSIVVLVGVASGLAAGLINGLLVTGLSVHSIVVTIGTLSLYRGIATAIVTDGAFTKFPQGLFFFGRYHIGGVVPFEFVFYAFVSLLFGVLLHFTIYGRRIFAIGNNPDAARYSGIAVKRYRIAIFAATGLMSGVAAVFLVSRLGSVRLSIAQGWELHVITMVVLGGVSISGGVGSILGVTLSVFLIGMLMFGLSLVNVEAITINLSLGVLLLLAIAVPSLLRRLPGSWTKRR